VAEGLWIPRAGHRQQHQRSFDVRTAKCALCPAEVNFIDDKGQRRINQHSAVDIALRNSDATADAPDDRRQRSLSLSSSTHHAEPSGLRRAPPSANSQALTKRRRTLDGLDIRATGNSLPYQRRDSPLPSNQGVGLDGWRRFHTRLEWATLLAKRT